MILKNISRSIVGYVLKNIFPLNISSYVFLPARFYQNCQAVFMGLQGVGKSCS